MLALRVVHLQVEAGLDGEVPAEINDETEATLMQELGRRLRLRVRAQDSVAWLGGRDFGAVLLCVDEAQARSVAARLSRVVGGRYRLGRTLLGVQVTRGVAAQDGACVWICWQGTQRHRTMCPRRTRGVQLSGTSRHQVSRRAWRLNGPWAWQKGHC